MNVYKCLNNDLDVLIVNFHVQEWSLKLDPMSYGRNPSSKKDISIPVLFKFHIFAF